MCKFFHQLLQLGGLLSSNIVVLKWSLCCRYIVVANMPSVSIRPARITQAYEEQVVELAERAMAEFMHVSQAQSPLWFLPASPDDHHAAEDNHDVPQQRMEQLNLAQYLRQFAGGTLAAIRRTRRGMKTEATRDRILVEADGPRIVESFMNPCTWMDTFACMVSRAEVLAILEAGVPGNRHGALLIMMAEMIPEAVSPSAHNVPTGARRLHFLRYCKQQQPGFWAIVDVSVDNLGSINPTAPPSSIRLRRRPSGVLIRSHDQGRGGRERCCQVTAVEHLEYYIADPAFELQPLMRTPVSSSELTFGSAQRWLTTLQHESPNLPMLESSPPLPPPPPQQLRATVPTLLNLAANRVAAHTTAANGGTAFTPGTNANGGAPSVHPYLHLDN